MYGVFQLYSSCRCVSVTDDDKRFSEWKSTFDVQAHQSEISQLLVNCSHIRTLHAQLVCPCVYEFYDHVIATNHCNDITVMSLQSLTIT